ncbi:MAG: hypothetical protein NTW30_02105 [Candidatus Aenigmarchaeota archaeon]|nr:hypothetical protein [Candidatus Aenigmarchaeota archaeon]
MPWFGKKTTNVPKVTVKDVGFSIDDFLQSYDKSIHGILRNKDYLHPVTLLKVLEDQGKTDEGVYILAKGTAKQVTVYVEKTYPKLQTEDGQKITGVYVANALREFLVKRALEDHSGKGEKTTEETIRTMFPQLEELYEKPNLTEKKGSGSTNIG